MLRSPVGIATLAVSFVPNNSSSAVKEDYKGSLIHLIQMTEEHVYKHIAADASVITSIAQRVDPRLKIKASIDASKRQYGKVLTSVFKDRSAGIDLHALHTDIVTV
ncbi:hypothetical protein M405DRAFT_603863 [Rhizopogon salebrosus TDB-379]|nr:hypothetical protein M405DRAFT_603863 [Rhizopogon salebrosus TDB-379]